MSFGICRGNGYTYGGLFDRLDCKLVSFYIEFVQINTIAVCILLHLNKMNKLIKQNKNLIIKLKRLALENDGVSGIKQNKNLIIKLKKLALGNDGVSGKIINFYIV